MNGLGKLTIAVADMRGKSHRRNCHWLAAIRLVAEGECEPSLARDAVLEQVDKMLAMCRAFCCEYDNLRVLTARLEREQGVKVPRFWCGKINKTGDPKKCRQCEALTRKGDSRG